MALPDSPLTQLPIGIDLGTTYSVVAYLDATGRPVTVLNGAGELLTPSAVAFEDEQIIVGKEAVKSSVFEPAAFADCFKRDMGRPSFRRTIGAAQVPPEVLSGFILESLKLDAERRLGPIRQVVITVPAFFDETRRRATQEAGRLAGLEVLDIINEPTAAAIAFGFYRTTSQVPSAGTPPAHERIIVYDLGGGTFDVTVLEIDGQTFRTLATDGDVQLGGKDFDERLVNYIADKFIATHGIDPRSDPHDAAQLWLDMQDAKHALSERMKTNVLCFHAGIRMRVEVTRADFEQLTADLLERTETTTQFVVRQAKLDWNAVDRILLVGGSSRMPMVVEMLRRVAGKEPDRSLSPDEVVAHGAALYASVLMAKSRSNKPAFKVVNVNSHSLGIVGVDQRTNIRRNVILIPKNSPLPCSAVRRFSTARANQRSVKIAVVEGESERPEHCIALGECVIRDLPPGLPKGTRVEVEYRYASNGRLSVLARVPAARQSTTVDIEHRAAPNLEDLETWRRRLCRGAVAESDHPIATSNPTSQSEAFDRATGANSSVVRLDELFLQLGKHAIKSQLPESLKRSQMAALASAKELQATAADLQRVEKKRQVAVGHSESLQAAAEVSKARLAVQQAETKTNFAHVVLGRDCVTANHFPSGLERIIAEIQNLQSSMGPRR